MKRKRKKPKKNSPIPSTRLLLPQSPPNAHHFFPHHLRALRDARFDDLGILRDVLLDDLRVLRIGLEAVPHAYDQGDDDADDEVAWSSGIGRGGSGLGYHHRLSW